MAPQPATVDVALNAPHGIPMPSPTTRSPQNLKLRPQAGPSIPEDKASQTISISLSLRQAMHLKKVRLKFLKGNKNKKPLSIQHAL